MRAGLALVASLTFLPGAFAQYLLNPGDVVEMSVAGVPEMRTSVRVNIDGDISLPLVGDVHVAGQSLAQVRDTIRSRLSGKFLRQTSATGIDTQVTFEPDKVSVNIADYRPVYVTGDVSRSGEQPFRPGMSVQQAIALAGGYDVARNRGVDPILQTADLRAEYETQWIEYAREQARISRLKAELNDDDTTASVKNDDLPLRPATLQEIQDIEKKALDNRQLERKRELEYLDKALGQATESYETVVEQRKKEEDGVKADLAELDKLSELEKKGATTSARVVEARRSVLLSSTRLLQTIAQATQVRREQTEIERRKTRVEETRRNEILRELQEAVVRLSSLNARLQSTGEKLLYTGALKSQLLRGQGRTVQIEVVRKTAGGTQKIAAAEDTELQSGDIVNVTLKVDVPAALSAAR